jgi:NAD(P)-dependent dehydrogenase (short-subunit alcohol dehydrogenase family)
VVIVGASSGIGRATALRFARHRGSLVLAARSRESLEEVAEECRSRGADVLVQPTDVSDETQVQALVDAAVERFGRIDVWIGVASVFSYGSFEDTPSEVFRQQLETNLMGQVHSARAVLPVFRSLGGSSGRKPSPRHPIGRIVFLASIYSRVTSPYASGYITAKHGLLGFSDTLREEVRRDGIEVSAVLPATIDTPIYQQSANYTGQRVHPLPPITSPTRVAAAIERITVHPKRAVKVGRSQGLLVPFRDLAPGVYSRAVRPAMDAMALRGGDVEPSPGNVFAPQPELNAISGGWRRPRFTRFLPIAAAGAALLLLRRARSSAR